MLSTTISVASTLPNLGDPSATVLSQSQEHKLGFKFMNAVRKQMPILDDPISDEFITTLGLRLASNSSDSSRHYKFFIVKAGGINAFAGPDGNIGVNSGLILSSRDESELAAVMAHEIAHVSQRHLARMMADMKQSQYTSIGLILASVLAGVAGGGGDVVGAGLATASASNVQNMLDFTRAHETEADAIGIISLAKSGFNPYAMPSFFEQMQKLTVSFSNKDIPEFLRTHPLTSNRISQAKNRAAQYPKKTYSNSVTYQLVKQRIRVLTNANTRQVLAFYKDKVKAQPSNSSLRYGYSLALYKHRQYKLAQQELKPLLTHDPDQVIYTLLKANIQVAEHEPSLKTLKSAYALHPDYPPLQLRYADQLLFAKQYMKAKTILRKALTESPRNPALYKLIAKTDFLMGNKRQAHLNNAKAYYLLGDLQSAKIQHLQSIDKKTFKKK